ncbi:fimbrillin family protein [Bacteroides sp.]
MKKNLFFALAIAAMTSCSQNDVLTQAPEAGQAPISFSPQLGNSVATRADVDLENTVSLGVFAFSNNTAYDNITDMRLRYVADDDVPGWYLNPRDHYYPADGSAVSFWAYGPKGNVHLKTIACDPTAGPSFDLSLTSVDMGPTAVDVFVTKAVATGKLATATTPVAFKLEHLLSQVKFKAKVDTKANAELYDVKLYDISVITKGTASYSAGSWTPTGTDVTWKPVDQDDTQAVLTENAADFGELVSVIPGQVTTIKVKARIYKKNQSALVVEQEAEIKLASTADYMAAGKTYTYTITITPSVGKIVFSAPQITDWEAVTDKVIPKA